jgi:branched-chain amino acid transport system permease protein
VIPRRPRIRAGARFALLLAALVALPLLVRPVVAAEIWIFAIAGMALNLIFGYTGMLSFGQATFFGLAAYTAGLMMIHWQAPLLAVLAAGTLVGALAAAAIGYVCIQRVGVYFIMLTFGFNQMLFFIAYKWTSLTGGDDGLPGIPRPPLAVGPLGIGLDSSLRYYVFVAAVFLLAFYAMKRIVDSPLGVIFRSIRENPVRAAAVGYDVKRYKWLAFTIAGGFTGCAGVLYSMMFGIVPLESISWIISGDIVFMVLIGGVGNLYGPLLGAAAFKWLSEAISVVWERWPLILGVALVLVVLFLRGGLVEAFARVRDAVAGGGRREPDERAPAGVTAGGETGR